MNFRRGGFTLAEVLVALALVLVLMGAIYTAVNMYRRLSTQGRDDVERTQVARAIQHKLAVDIRSVVFVKPEEESSQEEAQAAEEEALAEEEPTAPAEITDPSETATQTFNGIEGDSKSLVLHISRPPRFGAYTSALTGVRSVVGQGSDLISVTYLMSSPNGGSPLHQAVASRTGRTGLARIVGDRLAMDTADLAGAHDRIAEGATLLADEVVDVNFEYFDGMQWQTAWSTQQQGIMPRAIRVTLSMRIGKPAPNLSPNQIPVKFYTFVIPVTVSDPTPPEDALSLP